MHKILIKISGEYLELFNQTKILQLVSDIQKFLNLGYKISIVVGGGNIIRGRNSNLTFLHDHQIDTCGMHATYINGLILHYALTNINIRSKLVRHYDFEEDVVNIFVNGANNPYFSTDMAAVLKGSAMKVDLIVKATNTDGVYTANPKLDKTATKFDAITYDEYTDRKLACIDQEVIFIAKKNKMKILVVSISNLYENILNQNGTIIH